MSESGQKYDQEKPRTDLLDADFLIGVSKVLTFGARKYSAHNWRGGISYSRILAAILRHTFAILKGEDIDPETGELHTAHLGCEVMFLHWMMLNRKDMDDRYYGTPAKVGRQLQDSVTLASSTNGLRPKTPPLG